jgi:hypothetical protein
VSSYPTTTVKFATSSAEEALTADIRICWCGGAPSNGGTIFLTRPRQRLCGSGARRTASAGREITLCYQPVAFERIRPASYPGSGYIVRELSLFPSRFAQRDPHSRVGPGVRIRFPPAGSQVRTCLAREFAFLGASDALTVTGGLRILGKRGPFAVIAAGWYRCPGARNHEELKLVVDSRIRFKRLA